MGRKKKAKYGHGKPGRSGPPGNTNSVKTGAYSLLAALEKGRAIPAPVLIHLASKIRARCKDMGVSELFELSLAKQDVLRRGRVLDMALSRIEQSYLSGDIQELPERYFMMLRAWHMLEQSLGFERMPIDIPAHREQGATAALRRQFRFPSNDGSPPYPTASDTETLSEAARGQGEAVSAPVVNSETRETPSDTVTPEGSVQDRGEGEQ